MKSTITTDEEALLDEATRSGLLRKTAIYTRLSGPGWLQGALTLGGGSLAGALYLGILFGPHMLWLQPLAMICGVVMLSAITYVTLSTGERPFALIMKRVSPFLAWAWLAATVIANLVFCLPQFSLATAALQQNIAPVMADAPDSNVMKYVIGGVIFAICAVIVGFYNRGGLGIKIFERILKIMVGLIMLSFVGVVATLVAQGAVDFASVFKGHLPSLAYFNNPTPAFEAAIAETGENQALWTRIVTGDHAGIMIAAFGTAVGINMTFLLPYSMMKRRWGKKHRGMAIFDLSLGLIVPFFIATGCLVIASASQFHGKTGDVLDENGVPRPAMQGSYDAAIKPLIVQLQESGRAATAEEAQAMLTPQDREVAAMLAKRDVGQLASALEPFTGRFLAQKIFGFGVLGMAVSSIIMLMLINGFAATEALGRPDDRKIHFIAAMLPGVVGFFNPAIWTGASKAALAIPAATIAGGLIPIAYFTFLLLMNSRSALGTELPSGGRRIYWNTIMIVATTLVSCGAIWVTFKKAASHSLGDVMEVMGQVFSNPTAIFENASLFQRFMAITMLGAMTALFVLGLVGFIRKNRVTSA